jgi:cephalosporin-C deacetylase
VVWPADGGVDQAVVVGHGYGGRTEPDLTTVPEHAAAIFPVARGLESRGVLAGIPSKSAEHVLHGIDSVDTYVHGGCAADVWCAASALLALLPVAPEKLSYLGGSFGGGIGALALPWDHRFTAAALRMPSFGHHPLRLTLPCTGSGEAVRQYARKHPEVRDVLRYYDAAVAARHLRIPTLLGPSLWDPAVPPPGQFAVCNAVAGDKELFAFTAGHTDYPGDAEEADRFHQLAHKLFRG